MNFLSFNFVAFFIITISVYWFLKNEQHKKIELLVASYIFYSFASVRFLSLLIVISLSVHFIGRGIANSYNKKKKRAFLFLGVFICILTLGYFKYANFFISSFIKLFNIQNTISLNIILPLGISFYIFQAISYLADTYKGKINNKSIIKTLLYVGFFPQIVSGPIVKARDFFPQLEEEKKITKENLNYSFQLFLIGLFKKIVISNRIAIGINAVLTFPNLYSGLSLLVTVIGYSTLIYVDFSGYSDMAIAIARVFGYDLGLNFNMPYLAKNSSEFWGRWHISLSSWFKEYVYIPLGGNREGKLKTSFNLFITMLLSGLWHGASINFVIWGAAHGVLSIVYRCLYKKSNNIIIEYLQILINTVLVCILWIPFMSHNLSDALLIVKRIANLSSGINYINLWALLYTITMVIINIVILVNKNRDFIYKPLNLRFFRNKLIIATAIIFIMAFAYIGDSSFIYAQF